MLVADASTCIDGGAAPNADDCDETDSATYAGAPEIDGDGIDQDCNGFIDLITCYIDADGDGYGNDAAATTQIGDATTCTEGGAADYADDCDDNNAAVNPSVAESGVTACSDGLDNDCNGVLDAVDVGCGGTGVGDDDDATGDDDDTTGDDDATAGLVEGQLPGECEDGADNDADGDYDCNDADCAGAPVCADAAGSEGCDCSAGGQTGAASPSLFLLVLLALGFCRRRQAC